MRRAFALGLGLTASPAVAQVSEPVWTLIADGPGAHLAYAVPDSDDVRITLHCDEGGGKVTVLAPFSHRVESRLDEAGVWRDLQDRPEPWPITVDLASGPAKARVEGASRVYELGDGSMVEADLLVASPAIRAFAASGRLSMTAYGETVEQPPAPRRKVAAFLRACR